MLSMILLSVMMSNENHTKRMMTTLYLLNWFVLVYELYCWYTLCDFPYYHNSSNISKVFNIISNNSFYWMVDVSRLTFWHKLGYWPLVRLSFIGNGTHRSHESTGHWTWAPGHARWPGSRRSCSCQETYIKGLVHKICCNVERDKPWHAE